MMRHLIDRALDSPIVGSTIMVVLFAIAYAAIIGGLA